MVTHAVLCTKQLNAHLSVFSNAVHSILIIAEVNGINFPLMRLPAHGALMLLHVYGKKDNHSFHRNYQGSFKCIECIVKRQREHVNECYNACYKSCIIAEFWVGPAPTPFSLTNHQHKKKNMSTVHMTLWSQAYTIRVDTPHYLLSTRDLSESVGNDGIGRCWHPEKEPFRNLDFRLRNIGFKAAHFMNSTPECSENCFCTIFSDAAHESELPLWITAL